jgi:hypothetical protein
MSLIKLSAGNDQYWLMNDIPHQRGQFDVSAKIGEDVVEIYSLNTLKSLARANYDEFSPDGITPYASTQALIDDLKTFFFHSLTGGGGGVSSVTATSPLASSGGATPNIDIIDGANINDILKWNGVNWVVSSLNKTIVNNPVTPYTPTEYNEIIIWDCTTGNKVVDLPQASLSTSMEINIKKIDNTSNTLTINTVGVEEIDGGSNAVLTTQYEAITLISNGTNWFIL